MSDSTLESAFIFYLRSIGADLPAPVQQARLIPDPKAKKKGGMTRHKCDFAWVEQRVIVELEGGTWQGGRHTNPVGFRNDCLKYNALTVLGYRVLRFTTDMLSDDPHGCIEQIRTLIHSVDSI